MLNTQSPIPLYHQLCDILLAKVRSGEYAPGKKIPSENDLAAAYGIGRPTARQAIDLLVRRRVLSRRRGAGTFVREEQAEVDLFSLAGTISSFQKKGIKAISRIIEKTRLRRIEAGSENPFSGGKAFYLSRLSLVDEEPVLLEEIYLHPELFSGIDQLDLTGHSLSRIVAERYYMRLSSGRQSFRIGFADAEKARVLALSPQSPILLVKRFLNFSQADSAIYSDLYCRTDRFSFSQTIGGFTNE